MSKIPVEVGKDYFDELLVRIKAIRASEKRYYETIRDIFSLSYDYKALSPTLVDKFFRECQCQMIHSITEHTPSEIIYSRANCKDENMGLTNWKGAKVCKSDVRISKNYLYENEIGELNNIAGMFLDYATDQAKRHKIIKLKDWEKKLKDFIEFTGREVLTNGGKISTAFAHKKAHSEYSKYQKLTAKKSATIKTKASTKQIAVKKKSTSK